MPAPLISADEVVSVQQAEAYRALALAGVEYAAARHRDTLRYERTVSGLRERIAAKDARIAELEAEIRRYTAAMVGGSEAA